MKRALWFLGLLAILAAILLAIYVARPRLYLLSFVAVGLFILAVYGALWFRKARAANWFVSLAAASVFLALLDPFAALTQHDVVQLEGSWSDRYHYVFDDQLGIVLPRGVKGEARKLTDGHLDYDVIYTIDADGHRATSSSADPAAGNVLFIGCSFTFGQGLNDDETLPQQFSTLTGQHYHVVNLGVPTYGLHQPVRILELGLADADLTKGPRIIVYSAIPDHARRAGAAYDWAARGPAYQLSPEGVASYRGNLYGPIAGLTIAAGSRSLFLSRYVFGPWLGHSHADPVPLYIGLVKRARQLAEEKYHAQFVMIFWDDPEPGEPTARIEAELERQGIAYVRVSSIIPDLVTNSAAYRVSPFDQHPNAAANRLIAAYLAKRFAESPAIP
jgi:hypothetical protein